MSRDCPTQSMRACYVCGMTGHVQRDCPQSQTGGNVYNHLVKQTSLIKVKQGGYQAQTKACYNCGQTGHVLRDCPAANSTKTCYTCGGRLLNGFNSKK